MSASRRYLCGPRVDRDAVRPPAHSERVIDGIPSTADARALARLARAGRPLSASEIRGPDIDTEGETILGLTNPTGGSPLAWCSRWDTRLDVALFEITRPGRAALQRYRARHGSLGLTHLDRAIK